ncbi:Protein kinase domain [Trinorchestia longiramus]|nr:Protein kinase domain [Trinorchestia longiramus]
MATQEMNDSLRHCFRPAPSFLLDSHSFSTKKERRTPRNIAPPKPPTKSCPVTRIFNNRPPVLSAPVPVSFKTHIDYSFIADSPIYNCRGGTSYFEQCYEIEDKLGKGSFGEVYRVRCKDDGRVYACKKTIFKFRGDSDRRRRLAEVAKHEKLPKHPNCVEFHRAWEERQHLYILTEVCQKSLATLAEESPGCLPECKVWKYALDLLQALDHLHRNSLVHMDIKPENIFLSNDGTCKLGDFGLMFDLSKDDIHDAIEGDPKYMAPECLSSVFGPPADLFSLGISLLELALDLDLPTQGSVWQSLRQGILPASFSSLSPSLQELLMGLLEPEPKKRFTAAQALLLPHLKFLRKKQRLINFLKAGAKVAHSTWRTVLSCIFWVLSPIVRRVRVPSRLFNKLLSDARDSGSSGQPATPPNRNNDLCNNSFLTHSPARDDSFCSNVPSPAMCRPFRPAERQLSSTPAPLPTFQCSGPPQYSNHEQQFSDGAGRRPLPSLPPEINLSANLSENSMALNSSRLCDEPGTSTPCSSRLRTPVVCDASGELNREKASRSLRDSLFKCPTRMPASPFPKSGLQSLRNSPKTLLNQNTPMAPPTPQVSVIINPATSQSSRIPKRSDPAVSCTPTSQTLSRRLFSPSGVRQRSNQALGSPLLGMRDSRRFSLVSEDSVDLGQVTACTSRNLMDIFDKVDCSDSD